MIYLFDKEKIAIYQNKLITIVLSLTQRLLIIVLMLSSTLSATAAIQKAALWSQILASDSFSSNSQFLYLLDGQLRLNAQGKTLDTTVIRLGLGYQLTNRTQLFTGYMMFPTTDDQGNGIILEQRFWQQLNYTISPTHRLYTNSSTRLEQRFNKYEDGTAWRLREKVSIFWQNPKEGHVTPIVSDEVFINLNNPDWITKSLIDQNRFFIGLAMPLEKNRQLNIGYLSVYQFLSRQNINRNVLFISLSI